MARPLLKGNVYSGNGEKKGKKKAGGGLENGKFVGGEPTKKV